jgi:hypothetical protein
MMEHQTMSTTFDPKTAPPSVFPAHDAAAYEQIMGRWSRRLAPLLVEFGGLADGTACSMSAAGPAASAMRCRKRPMSLPLPPSTRPRCFSVYARKRSADPRFTFHRADARALPFADGSFDRAFSMLVL